MSDDKPGQKAQMVVKWVVGILVAAVAVPVIFLALKAVLGLLALGVAAAVGFVMLKLTPWFAQKATNIGIRLFVREVEGNPIESMESLFIEKNQEADQADGEIVEFETEVRNFDDETEEFAKTDPTEAPAFKEIGSQMHAALKSMKEEQAHARAQLEDLRERIQKAKRIYKMSLAAQRVAQLSRTAEKQVFQQIKEQVAFDTVKTELNRSFAALNMAVARRKNINSLPPARVEVLPLAAGDKQRTP